MNTRGDPVPLVEQPGRRARAPGDLALLQAFVNTYDMEAGRDEIDSPDRLGRWLATLGRSAEEVSAADHRRAISIREGLRELAAANSEDSPGGANLAELNRAAAELPLTARFGIGGAWHLKPGVANPDAFLAELIAIAARALADGTWSRVKTCQNHGCRWLYYDHSRNRSSTWCSMAICGARAKARAYRARAHAVRTKES